MLPIDTDTLAEVFQMWRCIKPHPITCRLQYSRQKVRSRPFTVGAADVYGFEFSMWKPEVFIQKQGVFQTRFISLLAYRLKHRCSRVQEINSFGVCHLMSVYSEPKKEIVIYLYDKYLFIHF